jgi:hypothetical protein
LECIYARARIVYVIGIYDRLRLCQTSRTSGDKDERCSRINNTRSGLKDESRRTVTYGLVDPPEIASRKSVSEGTFIRPHVSTQILQTQLATGTYVNVISPVNFEWSVPPKVSSPFLYESAFVGSKETATILAEMVPWLKRLSVTVGILSPLDGESEPTVRFVGPMLRSMSSTNLHQRRHGLTQGYRPRLEYH